MDGGFSIPIVKPGDVVNLRRYLGAKCQYSEDVDPKSQYGEYILSIMSI